MKRICVFCGSGNGTRPEFMKLAKELGQFLARQEVAVVYGGASVGLMGIVANSALELGGQVIGVIPKALQEKELAHQGLTELHVVTSMHERKALMAQLSDGFVVLPGGAGTMDEFFEIWTWAQLGIHQKPIGILSVLGFYDGLMGHIATMADTGFLRGDHQKMLMVDDSPEALWKQMCAYQPPGSKWADPNDKVVKPAL